MERWLNRGRLRRLKGAVTALLLIAAVYVGFYFLMQWLYGINVFLGMGVGAVCVFYCLAGTTLIREVRDVFHALDRSLEEGRAQVARIVGRDTSSLSAQEVRQAALETLAENLNDGVVAPLFWYLLLGVPGMMAYKMVNTLDSMIGYRTERYHDFGCWAARIDDVANYLPARITALLMLLVTWRLGRLSFVTWYGREQDSPNSGYPEAALAAILDCRFGGPHTYFGEYFEKPYIGTNERPLTTDDMRRACAVNRRVEVVMVLLVVLIRYIVRMM
jgi:adenosylcobinamide-phosphate synthase